MFLKTSNNNSFRKTTFLVIVILGVIFNAIIINANTPVFTNPNADTSDYNRIESINYMDDYTTERNTYYASFSGIGGNCTNFASQVLENGGLPFTEQTEYPTEEHWYYYTPSWGMGRTSTWPHSHWFRKHWGDVNGQGVRRSYRQTNYTVYEALNSLSDIANNVMLGDIIQYTDSSDGQTYHSQVVRERYNPYPFNNPYIEMAEHDGVWGDGFCSLRTFLQNRVQVGRGNDWVSVIEIKSSW
ncbi:amidase domain-containing protein [Herbivorax sp. ANBcel31]|uniref:amidase domain-containing protein n=1 Tax=Herbivorax sp. ANBcel31 TaxID=3069754 RepID=UPI0027B0F686|nr:amidase domain-containing protein [Herbivorax sp. ANBcel31]MDQ2088175.1 amidase domain-containing protein [Herbivorax sp. ANBcel31]